MPVLIHQRRPPSSVSHIRGIDEGAWHALLHPYHRFRDVRFLRVLQVASPDDFVVVHHDELSKPLHHFESASFLEPFHQNSSGTDITLILTRKELDLVIQVVADSARRSVCPKGYNPLSTSSFTRTLL